MSEETKHTRNAPNILEMQELFEQTPIEVWREYASNGYLWAEMIMEEFSYARPRGEGSR
jgi:hypothetical protein